jgi:hypothetical protein
LARTAGRCATRRQVGKVPLTGRLPAELLCKKTSRNNHKSFRPPSRWTRQRWAHGDGRSAEPEASARCEGYRRSATRACPGRSRHRHRQRARRKPWTSAIPVSARLPITRGAYVADFIRDARAAGCSIGTPPSNLGFRLVRDDDSRHAQRLLLAWMRRLL